VTKRESNFLFGSGMYFQTGQVIFVQNGQKGSLLVCNRPHFDWTKSLDVKMIFNKVFTI
jgi:hypothetical protein